MDKSRVFRWAGVVNAVVLVVALLVAVTHSSGGSVRLTAAGVVGGSRVTFIPTPPPSAAALAPEPAVTHTAPAPSYSGHYVYTPPAPRAPDPPVPASTMVAEPNGTIPTFTDANGVQNGTIGTWWNYPLVLPVTMVEGNWLQVRRPERPNGSVTWIRASDATIGSDPYYMVIDVGPEVLKIYQSGQEIMSFPIGVGKPWTPTPTGNFFIAIHESSSGYEYGPLILDTSAHSNAIQSWDGQGDAIIAIHGPIDHNADSRIGSGNAQVSNGCIRMHNQDLAQLSFIPVGTPLDIYP